MQRDSGAPLYEFFAGGGLARLGLEPDFACVFANDIEPAKVRAYRAAFGGEDMHEGDVWALAPGKLPGKAALAWASFPCQDVSLAGARRGLAAPRSGAFWGFHRLIEKLAHEGRAPDVLALENVCGLLEFARRRRFRGFGLSARWPGLSRRRAGDRRGVVHAAIAAAPFHHRCARCAGGAHIAARRLRPFHTQAIRNVGGAPARWLCASASCGGGSIRRSSATRASRTFSMRRRKASAGTAMRKLQRLIEQMSPLQRARLDALQRKRTARSGRGVSAYSR